jgi:DNA-binding NarL/FixJ family response regulator
VIVLTTFDDDETVFEGLRAGAVGYLLKDVSSDKLTEAIRAANRGEYFCCLPLPRKLFQSFQESQNLYLVIRIFFWLIPSRREKSKF